MTTRLMTATRKAVQAGARKQVLRASGHGSCAFIKYMQRASRERTKRRFPYSLRARKVELLLHPSRFRKKSREPLTCPELFAHSNLKSIQLSASYPKSHTAHQLVPSFSQNHRAHRKISPKSSGQVAQMREKLRKQAPARANFARARIHPRPYLGTSCKLL